MSVIVTNISSKRKKERGGGGEEGMALSTDNEKTTKSRPPFLRATHASEVVGLIRDRSTIQREKENLHLS